MRRGWPKWDYRLVFTSLNHQRSLSGITFCRRGRWTAGTLSADSYCRILRLPDAEKLGKGAEDWIDMACIAGISLERAGEMMSRVIEGEGDMEIRKAGVRCKPVVST